MALIWGSHMPFTRMTRLGLAMVIVVTVFSSVSSAQIKRPLRWLGEGFSDGYHRCNPGPNSDYYNPYSANNSYLHHKSAAPSSFSSNSYRTNRTEEFGAPFSVPAVPASFGSESTLSTLPSRIFDSSYVPTLSFTPIPANAEPIRPIAHPIANNDWPTSNNDWPSMSNEWPSTHDNSKMGLGKKKDSSFAPQLKKRFRQRSADSFSSPSWFSVIEH